MTYHGIQLLGELAGEVTVSPFHSHRPTALADQAASADWANKPDRANKTAHADDTAQAGSAIQSRPADRADVFEIYPGGTLRALGIPTRGYKRGRDWADARRSIVQALGTLSDLPVCLTPTQKQHCLANDNALDAVAACLTVALLSRRPDWFTPPPDAPGDWQREGWIWVPRRSSR